MNSRVFDFTLHARRTGEFRKLRKKIVNGSTCINDLNAGCCAFGVGGRCIQGSEFISELFAFAVHQETKVRKKINANDWLCDIGYDESPSEVAA
jgi:hypothetical protein